MTAEDEMRWDAMTERKKKKNMKRMIIDFEPNWKSENLLWDELWIIYPLEKKENKKTRNSVVRRCERHQLSRCLSSTRFSSSCFLVSQKSSSHSGGSMFSIACASRFVLLHFEYIFQFYLLMSLLSSSSTSPVSLLPVVEVALSMLTGFAPNTK